MITYQREKFIDVMTELANLVIRHHAEIEKNYFSNLDVSWKSYLQLEANDNLLLYTVRSDDKLIGYYIATIYNHIHYKHMKTSQADAFYVLPEYRKGRVGLRLLLGAEQEAKNLQVKLILVSFRHGSRLISVMDRLKFKPLDVVYYKEI